MIQQDRSRGAIQFSKVFADLLPLLEALKPAELNATLNAMATALQGNGAELGQNIDQFDDYLKRLNPQVPTLVQDLDALGQGRAEYNRPTPALVDTLKNLQTPSRTLIDKQAGLSTSCSSMPPTPRTRCRRFRPTTPAS